MINLFNLLNAADRVAVGQSNFQILDLSLAFGPKPTLVDGVENTVAGAPTTGAWETGQVWIDKDLYVYRCTAGGTPGTWVLTWVTAIPTGANCRFKRAAGWQFWDATANGWRTLGVDDGETVWGTAE
jgi:hypothetical protein